MESPPRLLIPVAIGLFFLSACGDSATGPADQDGDGILDNLDQCVSSPETVNGWQDADGCPDTTTEFYGLVRSDAEAFWDELLAQTIDYVFLAGFFSYQSPITTPCGEIPINNAFYCGSNASVYYYLGLLDRFLVDIGDMAPAFVVAHEIGHHVSVQLGWIPGVTLTRKEFELQADCLAGVWTRWVGDRGLLETGDLEEAVETLIQVGDPDWTWFLPTLHGTPAQRVLAFAIGHEDPGRGAACTSQEFFDIFPSRSHDTLNKNEGGLMILPPRTHD